MITPKKAINKIVSINGSPEFVAKGFALGSFIGMIPIPGFQIIISLAIASFINVSKKAAAIGALNTNVITGVFFFALNYWIGKKILGVNPSFVIPDKINWTFTSQILEAGSDVFLSMLVGGLITGILFAVISYYLIKKWLTNKKALQSTASFKKEIEKVEL